MYQNNFKRVYVWSHRTGNQQAAMGWCTLSMKLLDYLTDFKQSYETKVSSTCYCKIVVRFGS